MVGGEVVAPWSTTLWGEARKDEGVDAMVSLWAWLTDHHAMEAYVPDLRGNVSVLVIACMSINQ